MTAKILLKEAEEFERRRQNLDKSMKSMDEEFMQWKESVLKFEHCEYCIDDDSGSDSGVCDRECIWSDEDEDDIQRTPEQTDGEHEGDYEFGEGGTKD